jgi:hypothetical protein
MKKLTRKQAFELSIEKWELIIKNKGRRPIFPDRIEQLFNSCGLCELYYCTNECPLCLDGETCTWNNHPYNDWACNNSVENAQAVLDLIKSKQ